MGIADVICDIRSSGDTLARNGLKPLADGLVSKTQASVLACRSTLSANHDKLATAEIFLKRIESCLEGMPRRSANPTRRHLSFASSPGDVSRELGPNYLYRVLRGYRP